MRSIDAYADLKRIGRPVITTGEAAARLRVSNPYASKQLKLMEDAGLIRRLKRGIWSLDIEIDPTILPPYLTAPEPAYVSMFSALARHGMIEQIPRRITAVSTDRARRIPTAVGVFEIHQLAPEVFGGFEGTASRGYIAKPEKALFDTVYVRSASGSTAYFPELSISSGFDQSAIDYWIDQIAGSRLRTIVLRRLAEVVGEAATEAGDSR